MTLDREQVEEALPAYDVGGELGRGGWGVVLEARHRRLGRDVAVKQLPRAFAADPAVRARFVAEAQVLASLDHPHIVPVYDYVEVDGLCLLVMEQLPGGTLWDRFLDGLTMENSCATVLAACAGLHAAHQRGILHRDVKPENLMFSATGVLKVTDFGIAKVVGGGRTMATRAGEVLGTPSYMAPEHARGEPLGPAADVYATGVLLFELLSGQLPFSDEGDAISVLYRHVHESPAALGDIAPQVPAPVATVVMKALASHSDERYPSAEAFGVALADAAGAAWGPGWASARTQVAVMGSAPIVSAIERSGSFAAPAPARAPATVQYPAVPAAPTPAPPTAAVRPAAVNAERHVRQPRESHDQVSLHDVRALVEPRPVGYRRRRRLVASLAVAVVLAGVVAAGILSAGGGSNPGRDVVVAPATTATSAPAARLILQDDFSNPDSGWTQTDTADYRIGYVSGRYLVLARRPGLRVTSDTSLEGPAYRAELVSLGDVAIEADAENVVAVRTGFGLMCRRAEDGSFYMALVDTAGRAIVEKVGTTGRSMLAERPFDKAGQAGPRHLRMECVGEAGTAIALRFFVDGVLVVDATDPTALGPGAAGVVLNSEDRPGSQALFDNFVVREAAAG